MANKCSSFWQNLGHFCLALICLAIFLCNLIDPAYPFRVNSRKKVVDRINPDNLDNEVADEWLLEQDAVVPGIRRFDASGPELDSAEEDEVERKLRLIRQNGIRRSDVQESTSQLKNQRNDRQLLKNLNIRNVLQNLDFLGLSGGLAAQVDLVAASDSGVTGTLKLNQSHVLANMIIQGTITGLKDSQAINIHGRTTSDISDDCANQGDFRNPHNASAAGGFLVKFTNADETGTVTLDEKVAAVDASLYRPWGLLNRSIRVSAGDSQEGEVLACGMVVSLDQVAAPAGGTGTGGGTGGGTGRAIRRRQTGKSWKKTFLERKKN